MSTLWIFTLLNICNFNFKSSMNVILEGYEAKDFK